MTQPDPSGRLYRNLFFLHSAYTVFGYMLFFASMIGPADWFGVGLGASLVASAWAFWTVVDMQFFRDDRRPTPLLYVLAATPVMATAVALIRGHFALEMLLWLVMPAAFAWWAHSRPHTKSSDGDGNPISPP